MNLNEKLTFKQYLIESSIEHDLFVGRFQPFHKGHANVVAKMKNPIIAVVKGGKTSEDKEKNPLTFEQQKILIQTVFPNAEVIEVKNANLYGILYHLNKEGKNIRKVFAGEDRLDSYKKAVEKSNQETGKNVEVEQTPRFTSATTVRNVIRSGKYDEYVKLMPAELANEKTFNMLRNVIVGKQNIEEGRESEYAAWLALANQAKQQKTPKEIETQNVLKNIRLNQIEYHKKQLQKHKEALEKTRQGSEAREIIGKKVAYHQQQLDRLMRA